MASKDEVPASKPLASAEYGEPDRRTRIIGAANELLDEAGLEGLTIRAVLKRTGLARRAFYESFAGKDDLVLAVFDRSLLSAATSFGQLSQALNDPAEGIRAVVNGLVIGRHEMDADFVDSVDRRSAALVREHLRLAEARPAELQAALKPLLDVIAAQVRDGIRTGQFRECDPELQARLIYNLVSTTVHTVLLAEDSGKSDREQRQELARELWDFCRRAIVS